MKVAGRSDLLAIVFASSMRDLRPLAAVADPPQVTENVLPLTADTMMCGLVPVTFTGSWLPSGEPFTVSPVNAAGTLKQVRRATNLNGHRRGGRG